MTEVVVQASIVIRVLAKVVVGTSMGTCATCPVQRATSMAAEQLRGAIVLIVGAVIVAGAVVVGAVMTAELWL